MVSITRQSVLTLIAVLVGVLLLVLVAAWRFQERIAFQPHGPPYPDAGDVRRVQYQAADGQNLFAYVIGDPALSKGFVLAFHGNADVAVTWIEWAHEIERRTGASVMLAEYRGYAGLPGRPTYNGVQLDSRAAFDFARDTLDAPVDRIAYFGHSLGSAVAAELSLEHTPRALILEAPFTSARDMAAVIAGRWLTLSLWRVISRLHFDTVRIVASLDAPVSVVHGMRDRVVPYRMGVAVYDAAKVKGEWLSVPKASHSDIQYVAGDPYWTWLTGALSTVTSGK
ncbi:MAG TPA: alpha/beta hydrolase [Gemmatimonadaceae bacterium]